MKIDPVIFRQYDIRGTVGKDLTADVARLVGRAVGAEATKRLGKAPTLAVGRDNRPSGVMLSAALIEGLISSGVRVIDVGLVPTPVLYFAIVNLEADGGVQVTGSHNPPEFNGLKMVLDGLPFSGDDIQGLLTRIQNDDFTDAAGGRRETADVIDAYRAEVVRRIGKLPRKVKVVVDCGNGTGSVVAPQLVRDLGAEIIELFCESDGSFPNHHPDPSEPHNLDDLRRKVKETGAELGIAFDGDADRIGAVDEHAEIIAGDQILIILGRDMTRRLGKGREVIFDVKCSDTLPRALEAVGAKPVMWMTGHSFIKKKMKESGACLAGEMSGHMFFGPPDYLGFDDAMFAAARVLHIVAEGQPGLARLLADVPRLVSTPEIRVNTTEQKKVPAVQAAAKYFSGKYETVTIDGVRWRTPEGWGLIRSSNTQPILVMRFEAKTQQALDAIRREAVQVLAQEGVSVPGA